MVVLSIEFGKHGFKVLADFFEDAAHFIQDGLCKNFSPVFRHKDQMNMNIKNAMSACADFT